MAILTTVGGAGFTNIGHDLQISLVGGALPALIPNVMSLQWKQNTIDIVHTQMNGVPLYADLPNGYEGVIEFHRHDGSFERELILIQQSWLQQQTPVYRTLACIVLGAGGGVFTFTNVTIKMEDAGDWRGDEVTRCRLQFKASLMI